MPRSFRTHLPWLVGWVSLLCLGTSVASGQAKVPDPRPESLTEHVDAARKFGWLAVAQLMNSVGQSDPKKFPGLVAFHGDYKKAVAKLDPERPPGEWPEIDIEALLTKNPNFWRANYEMRPGDPAWMYTHAGLLLGAGEATRAQEILILAKQSRGTPGAVQGALNQMIGIAENVINEGNEAVGEGFKLYDKGDIAAAVECYRKVLKAWPQDGFASYELALSLRTEAMKKKGEKVPPLGVVIVGEKLTTTPEADECIAQARLHDPMRVESYQGSGEGVIDRLKAIGEAASAWNEIFKAPPMKAPAEAIVQFSEGCQKAGADDLALIGRQLVIGNRRQLTRADHDFVATSLRKLVPGADAEAIVKFLDNPKLELRSMVDPEPD